MSSILVVALNQRGQSNPQTWELLGAGRALADASKQPLLAVLIGATAQQAQELVERGADRVLWTGHPTLQNFVNELYAQIVLETAQKEKPSHILLPSNVMGRSLAGRLAVKLEAGLATDVSRLDGGHAERNHYNGNLKAAVEFSSPIRVLTLQPMAFAPALRHSGRSGKIEELSFSPASTRAEFVSFQAEEAGEIDLGAAEGIVTGGRGVGGADGFKLLREFAHTLGAALGATRAAVDSGWIPYRHQVGLTGRTVSPKLYIACGASGQIQHMAGMSGSANIVAINTDAGCPMMQQATIAVVGDLFQLIPSIITEIKKRKGAL